MCCYKQPLPAAIASPHAIAPLLSSSYNLCTRILDRKSTGLIGSLKDELGVNPMGLSLFLSTPNNSAYTGGDSVPPPHSDVINSSDTHPKRVKRRRKRIAGALLFVADWDNHRILVFNAVDSSVLRQISGGYGSGVDQLIAPEGICLGSDPVDPLLYVCDSGNHRIQIFNAMSGRHVRAISSIGGKGSGAGQLNGPVAICTGSVDPGNAAGDQLLFVSEFHNNRVQVFDASTGLHVRMIGEGVLRGPRGLCLGPGPGRGVERADASDQLDQLLYVVDSVGGSIQVFNARTGAHVRVIEGADANQLKNPAGICLGGGSIMAGDTADRPIYVCDCGNSRIQVFDAHSGECTRSIPVGDVPFFIVTALDPGGRPLLITSVAQSCVRVMSC